MSTAVETGTAIRVEASCPSVIYFNEVDEEPELFSTEIRAAFESLRQGGHHDHHQHAP